jgi:hypothetical protein
LYVGSFGWQYKRLQMYFWLEKGALDIRTFLWLQEEEKKNLTPGHGIITLSHQMFSALSHRTTFLPKTKRDVRC